MKNGPGKWCWMVALAALMPIAAWSETIQFALSGAADKDVIFETQKGAKASSFGEKAEGNHALVEEGHADGAQVAKGLPKKRWLRSQKPELGEYQLLAYDKLNAIELASRSGSAPESHLIKVPGRKYKSLGLLVAAVHGDASFTLKLKYADGTEKVIWWEADDWHDEGDELRPGQKPVISKMDRVRVPEGSIDKAGRYSLFEFLVEPDSSKALESVTIGNDPNHWPEDADRWAVVFAINGATAD